MKFQENEQSWFILARSRFFIEKYDECDKYLDEALKKYPQSGKMIDLKKKCAAELDREKSTMRQITLIN